MRTVSPIRRTLPSIETCGGDQAVQPDGSTRRRSEPHERKKGQYRACSMNMSSQRDSSVHAPYDVMWLWAQSSQPALDRRGEAGDRRPDRPAELRPLHVQVDHPGQPLSVADEEMMHLVVGHGLGRVGEGRIGR